jgi:unsaturated chondroitin disaccharide hydrolase
VTIPTLPIGSRFAQVALALAVAFSACAPRGAPPNSSCALGNCLPSSIRAAANRDTAPRLILARGEYLAESRRRIWAGDSALLPAYRALLRRADSALTGEPLSVVQKMMLPPSGDRHDFMSLAPYWWPDSAAPNGLPYIRRDGVVNPQTRVDHDGLRLQRTIARVEQLALAHFLTGDARYSRHAHHLLRVWFIDPATRMNPHLRYAQAIPGVSEGRGIGIIDTRHLPQLVDALRLLEQTPGWSQSQQDALRQWMRAYLDWLLTSEHGRDERGETNNHGTWYDAQVAGLALFLDDSALARRVIVADTRRRLDAHIEADGRQPLELARTRPIHYSVFNLDAFSALAEMARHLGIDLWRSAAPRGGSLRAALRMVAPYADPAIRPPASEATPITPDVFVLPMRRAHAELGDPLFARAVDALPAEYGVTHLARLLYPGSAVPGSGNTAFDTLTDRALHYAAAQLRHAATTLDPRAGYPRVTRPDGSWERLPANQWTSGFFAGALWSLFQATHDPAWRELAERWTMGLEGVKTITTTHDLGFMLFNSFGHGYLLTGNPRFREVVLQGSRSLLTRYDPDVGAIRSWDTQHQTDRRGSWRFPVIVDNLMNLEMLFWAARHGGNPEWSAVAASHAMTSARAHVRPDGSTAHVALFDPTTGALERTTTWQGYSDSSTWARGQAWAIHGFTMAYRWTRNRALLDAAQRTADFFAGNLPADGVPYWDFRHPDIPRAERDASAAAIAASGLLDLARWSNAAAAARYRDVAMRILASLSSSYLTDGTSSAAILEHSVGQRPQNAEIDVGLVYADYYFIEGLLRSRGIFRD